MLPGRPQVPGRLQPRTYYVTPLNLGSLTCEMALWVHPDNIVRSIQCPELV